MAVVGNLHKIVFGGRLATTESWSCGLHFLSPDVTELDELLAAGGISQWFLRASSLLPNNALLEYLKMNQIVPATGLYMNPGMPRTYFFPAPGPPPASNAGIPQNTMAVSTTTALLRGRGSKGRFYPPLSGVIPAADGRMGSVTTQGVATSAAQLITDLNGANSGSCVVFSKVGQLTEEITGVRVGRIVDTQQRRRRNLIEEYLPASIS